MMRRNPKLKATLDGIAEFINDELVLAEPMTGEQVAAVMLAMRDGRLRKAFFDAEEMIHAEAKAG